MPGDGVRQARPQHHKLVLALPFLSYGMSSVIASCVAAGILLSVSGGAGGFLKRAAGAMR